MKQHQLTVSARFRPETLERILRVVRHRGFRVCALTMATQSDNICSGHDDDVMIIDSDISDNITIELTVTSQRPVELLCSQLYRLVDVSAVKVRPCHRQSLSGSRAIDQQVSQYAVNK